MTGLALRPQPTADAPARPSGLACLGVLALAYVVFGVTYLPINAFTEGRVTHTLFLPGERAIPLVPAFEFAYLLGYVLPLVVAWRRPDAARLARLAWAFGFTLVAARSEEHTSELQSLAYLVCRLLLEKKKMETTERRRRQNRVCATYVRTTSRSEWAR